MPSTTLDLKWIAGWLVTVALVLGAGWCAWLWRQARRAPGPPAPAAEPRDPTRFLPAIAVALVALPYVASVLARFRYAHDDFMYLVKVGWPFPSDEMMRLVSVEWLFRLGAPVGPGFFVAVNLVALLATAKLWGLLLARGGVPGPAAALAAALSLFAPGAADLLRSAAGSQQLLAYAIVLGATLCVDDAARAGEARPARRRAALGLASWLLVAGVFVKLAVVVLALPTIALWCWFVAPRAPGLRPLLRLVGPPFFAFLEAVLVIAPWTEGDLDRAGTSAAVVLRNLATVARFWPRPTGGLELLLPLPAPAVWSVALVVAGGLLLLQRGEERFAWVRRLAAVPLGRVPLLLAVPGLAALWLLPFLFNARYVAPYYGMLAFVAGSAAVAVLALEVGGGGRPAVVAALLAASAVFPVGDWHSVRDTGADREAAGWLAEVRAALEGLRPPAGEQPVVTVRAACADAAANPAALERLRGYLELTEGVWGFRWASGWPDLMLEIDGAAADSRLAEVVRQQPKMIDRVRPVHRVVFEFCPGRPAVGRDAGVEGDGRL